jgi:hypothetical protein
MICRSRPSRPSKPSAARPTLRLASLAQAPGKRALSDHDDLWQEAATHAMGDDDGRTWTVRLPDRTTQEYVQTPDGAIWAIEPDEDEEAER